MKHELPMLPYALDALAPKMSRKTLEFHHGKHHQAYVDNLNKLAAGTRFEDMPVEAIIREADAGPLFNNAAQVWNHTFFFDGLTPQQKLKEPEGMLLEAIEMSFGSFGSMKEQFSKAATALFGSGWVWLVIDGKELDIVPTANAYNPLKDGKTPILTLDVWEHAYYLDYQNRRAEFIANFWDLVDWEKVQQRFERGELKK